MEMLARRWAAKSTKSLVDRWRSWKDGGRVVNSSAVLAFYNCIPPPATVTALLRLVPGTATAGLLRKAVFGWSLRSGGGVWYWFD